MDTKEVERANLRWRDLELLQEHYAKFEDFLYDVITELMNFTCTDIQLDMAQFLETGPKYKMLQAQRGQAKTTITACYAVWRLIHDPTTRVLVVSAGSTMATEVANWVIQILMYMPELECLRPDTTAGDRSSVQAFDVHWHLKGPEKSPSVACVGLTSNMQGKRADILIADDIESTKNSQTATQRERLAHLTRDFSSICMDGDIIYLGTPQNNDSVYNGLPGRGFVIRVWPGRYPTFAEEENYCGTLAPIITNRLQQDPTLRTGGGPTGNRGKPVDPVLLGEDVLTAKEIDQGPAYFQLQHMLDTRLADEDKYPLKTRNIVFMRIPVQHAPTIINWANSGDSRILPPQGYPLQDRYYRASGFGQEFSDFTGTHMYVDPAGGGRNGDETAYAISKCLAGRVFLVDAGGIPGGLELDKLKMLTSIAVLWKPDQVDIEKNFGNGALSNVWTPLLIKEHPCSIEDVWENGQKELRIIDILEPLLGSQRLVVEEDLIKKDWASVQRYPTELKSTYSLFFQLSRMTRDRKSLIHDDKLDAVAGTCRHWLDHLKLDADKVAAKIKQDNYRKLVSDPLGNGRPVPGMTPDGVGGLANCLDKFRRGF